MITYDLEKKMERKFFQDELLRGRDYLEYTKEILCLECDISDEAMVNESAKKVLEKFGKIDILVNNAGIIKRIPMCEMSAKEFRQVIDVDLNAPFIVSKAVIPSMIKKGGGKIINICSMMSELGRETVSAYAAAKGGLKMLTKNIASEYGEFNIQCNGIGPGYIATPQTAPLRERQADGSRHPFDSFIIAKTPAGRWGEAEDLGGPAIFLASEASNFVIWPKPILPSLTPFQNSSTPKPIGVMAPIPVTTTLLLIYIPLLCATAHLYPPGFSIIFFCYMLIPPSTAIT
jgi:NAD(P)-dependent dehydrogenase (short-subunit alcohol dehydrogenase family)